MTLYRAYDKLEQPYACCPWEGDDSDSDSVAAAEEVRFGFRKTASNLRSLKTSYKSLSPNISKHVPKRYLTKQYQADREFRQMRFKQTFPWGMMLPQYLAHQDPYVSQSDESVSSQSDPRSKSVDSESASQESDTQKSQSTSDSSSSNNGSN
jgi:hypothetical protein